MSPSRRPVPLPCAPLPPSQLPTRITLRRDGCPPGLSARTLPPSHMCVPWCGPVAHRHYAREIRTQCPRLLSAPRRKTQNRPWRLVTFSAVGPPDPHHVDFVDAIDEEAPRKEAIDRVSTESGTPQSWRETGFTMAFTPAKRRLLCRVIHLKNTFQKTGILVRLVRIFPG